MIAGDYSSTPIRQHILEAKSMHVAFSLRGRRAKKYDVRAATTRSQPSKTLATASTSSARTNRPFAKLQLTCPVLRQTDTSKECGPQGKLDSYCMKSDPSATPSLVCMYAGVP